LNPQELSQISLQNDNAANQVTKLSANDTPESRIKVSFPEFSKSRTKSSLDFDNSLIYGKDIGTVQLFLNVLILYYKLLKFSLIILPLSYKLGWVNFPYYETWEIGSLYFD